MVRKRPDPDRVAPKVIVREAEARAVKPTEGSVKAQKVAARLAAVQVLYQMRVNGQQAGDAVREFLVHRVGYNLDGDVFVPAEPQLLQDIVLGVADRWGDIDDVLTASLAQGGRSEVELILECILRAGIFELMAHGDIDTGIIINDYLSVAAGFYEGGEPKLVNGILDKVAKRLRA
jgi:N utilization substance protein B